LPTLPTPVGPSGRRPLPKLCSGRATFSTGNVFVMTENALPLRAGCAQQGGVVVRRHVTTAGVMRPVQPARFRQGPAETTSIVEPEPASLPTLAFEKALLVTLVRHLAAGFASPSLTPPGSNPAATLVVRDA
jgi:hypothetical protein